MIGQERDDVIPVVSENTYQGVSAELWKTEQKFLERRVICQV